MLEDEAACDAVMSRLSGPRSKVVDARDVAAPVGRTRDLEAIGAIGPLALWGPR